MAKRKISRRRFLGELGLGSLSPILLGTAMDLLLQSMVNRAQAALVGGAKMNYLSFFSYEAPPRWAFDLVLTKKNTAISATTVMPNLMVKTKYSGATQYTDAVYEAFRYNIPTTTDFYDVPYIWGLDLSVAGTATQKAHELLRNAIFMRGVLSPSVQHDSATQSHFQTLPSEPSLHGQLADSSTSIVKTLMLNGVGLSYFQYKSNKGYRAVNYSVNPAKNGLASLFGVMQGKSANYLPPQSKANIAGFQTEFCAAARAIAAAQSGQYRNSLETEANLAIDQLFCGGANDFADLAERWTELFTKYKNTVNASFAAVHLGINDKEIGSTSLRAANPNHYKIDTNAGELVADQDLRLVAQSVNFDLLAAQFAIVEHVIKKGWTQALSVFLPYLDRITIGGAAYNFRPDQHNTGYMSGLLLNTKYYLAFSSCLLTLIESLKASGLYNETLISYSSEFGRTPRNAHADVANKPGGGSDHAPQAANISLFSGAIKKFEVIGNIRRDAGPLTYPIYSGSWGYGAPAFNGQLINMQIAMASIAHLLEGSLPTSIQPGQLPLLKTGTGLNAVISSRGGFANDNNVV